MEEEGINLFDMSTAGAAPALSKAMLRVLMSSPETPRAPGAPAATFHRIGGHGSGDFHYIHCHSTSVAPSLIT
jgi:hypothetical protein